MLCVLMLAGTLISCKKKEVEPDKDSDSTSGTVTTTGGEEGEKKKELYVENFSEGGVSKDYTMLVRPNRYHYLYNETDDSDRIKSAAFNRNAYINEKYGVNIKIATPVKDDAAGWSTTIEAADGAYDLMVPDYWYGLEEKGYFINLLSLKELDLTQDYWYSGWNKNVTINNRLYSATGDGSLEVLENIEVVFYNKTMAENEHVNLYETVDSGNWTIDEMLRLNALVAKNLDDGDESTNVYGALYDVHSMGAQLYSAGINLTSVSANGAIEIAADKPSNVDVADKVTRLINSPYTRYDKNTARSGKNQNSVLFQSEKSMFYATALYLGIKLKENVSGFEYGVLPMPKYDKDAEYVSTTYGASPFAIPVDAKNPHFSAVILEAINYLSSDNEYFDGSLVNSMFEIVMKGQVAQKRDDARMIEFAKSKVYIEFAFIRDGKDFKLYTTAKKAVLDQVSISGLMEGVVPVAQETLGKILEFYSK